MLSQHTKQAIKVRKMRRNSKKIISILTWVSIIAFVGLVVGSLIIARGRQHGEQVCVNVYHKTAECK